MAKHYRMACAFGCHLHHQRDPFIGWSWVSGRTLLHIMANMSLLPNVISGAWARGYPQISGAYDPGYSSGDILGHMPRISADIPRACSKSSNL